MPGKRIKRWNVYHALRRKRGMSKSRAAKIANARGRKRRK